MQQTPRQYHLPESGQKIASKANRDGVAERLPEPAGPKSMAGNLALSGHYAPLLRALQRAVLNTATQHDANTLSLLRTVPGLGEILRLVLPYASHAMERFPRVHDFVSYCRLVKCAKAAAGKRYGPSGPTIGTAYLQWAFSAAAVLFLRNPPAGQPS